MTTPDDLARLRAHLMASDARRLTWVSRIPADADLSEKVRELARKGHDLGVLDLSSEAWIDRDLDASTWHQRIVGEVADDAPLADQLARAAYLGLPAVLYTLPPAFDPGALRAVAEHVTGGTGHVWLRVPWSEEGWQRFDDVRWFFGHDRLVHVALDVSDAPPADDVVRRWCGEPVELLCPGTEAWPALAPLFRSVAERVWLAHDDTRLALEALHRAAWSEVGSRDRHAASFTGTAVAPIEPLGDDLPSETYEVIESDPVKYLRYHDAVFEVLRSKKDGATVAVVGAGRGGLVDEVLRAAKLANRTIDLVVLEKNPGALRTLEARNRRDWNGAATIVAADMRAWAPKKKLDVVVSELLGGFGDNELSPECLLPVERHLARGGVMIPRVYTSWIAPAFSAPLAAAVEDRERIHTVALDRAVLLAPAAPCFSFEHPGPGALDRSVTIDFEVELTGVVHGFAGFFETQLFGEVVLSIRPETATERMRSWTPVFFPLLEPFGVVAGELVRLCFFRRATERRVWYEWAVAAPSIGRLHNSGGRAFAMRRL